MVDKLDQVLVPAELGPLDYKGLYNAVSKALFRAHVEGQLKVLFGLLCMIYDYCF